MGLDDEKTEHEKVREERRPKLGDIEFGHAQLGRYWAASLSEYLQIVIPDVPATLVALMLVQLKIGRACRPGLFNSDHYLDMRNYTDFAEEFDQLNPHYKKSEVSEHTLDNLLHHADYSKRIYRDAIGKLEAECAELREKFKLFEKE